MRKFILGMALAFLCNVSLYAIESSTAPSVVVTESAQEGYAGNTMTAQDDFTQDATEEAKKKRRKKKKKKKNPVVKYVVGGVIAAAAIVLYVVTDGEGYHSR